MRRPFLALIIALAAAAPAAGAVIPQRYFAVTVKGVQTSTSSYHHPSSTACDPSDESTSSERVVFHSTHAKVILASYFDTLHLVSFGKGQPKEQEVPTTFSITRRSHSVHGTVGPGCADSGGGGVAPRSDCGTRTRKLVTQFSWLNPKGIQLEIPDYLTPAEPFQNCPVSGVLFPRLITTTTLGKPIYAHITAAELFDHAWRQHIIVGHGEFFTPEAEGWESTKIRWEVNLRAVPPPGRPHARVY
jgi:hypothetical protein